MVGERVEAGERNKKVNPKEKKSPTKCNTVPTVHENVVKYLKAMLFYMI